MVSLLLPPLALPCHLPRTTLPPPPLCQVHSVCGTRRDDPKQRSWFFLDPGECGGSTPLRPLPPQMPAHACLPPAGLLLPEYIVEYEYVFEGEEAEARAPPPAAAVAADSAGGGDGAGPAAATAGLPTVELVARCGHRAPMTVQLRSLVDAARLLAVAAQSWLAPDALPAPAWQHLVRQLRGVPSLQVRRGPGGVRE